MKNLPSLAQFTKSMTNGIGKPERRFIEAYGNVSFEEAYPVYVAGIVELFSVHDKIAAFETYLINKGVSEAQSNISESRYYNYNGIKYRFSTHIYPTGSMTSEFCIDFAANPELINTVKF